MLLSPASEKCMDDMCDDDNYVEDKDGSCDANGFRSKTPRVAVFEDWEEELCPFGLYDTDVWFFERLQDLRLGVHAPERLGVGVGLLCGFARLEAFSACPVEERVSIV